MAIDHSRQNGTKLAWPHSAHFLCKQRGQTFLYWYFFNKKNDDYHYHVLNNDDPKKKRVWYSGVKSSSVCRRPSFLHRERETAGRSWPTKRKFSGRPYTDLWHEACRHILFLPFSYRRCSCIFIYIQEREPWGRLWDGQEKRVGLFLPLIFSRLPTPPYPVGPLVLLCAHSVFACLFWK